LPARARGGEGALASSCRAPQVFLEKPAKFPLQVAFVAQLRRPLVQKYDGGKKEGEKGKNE